MPKTPLSLPQVRTIGLMQPMTWLVLAWRDMARAGWISFAHGLALTALGGVILALARLAAAESVTRIALDFGYESPGAFSTMFRRVLGQSPSNYLNRTDPSPGKTL